MSLGEPNEVLDELCMCLLEGKERVATRNSRDFRHPHLARTFFVGLNDAHGVVGSRHPMSIKAPDILKQSFELQYA